jgi:phage shock protein A
VVTTTPDMRTPTMAFFDERITHLEHQITLDERELSQEEAEVSRIKDRLAWMRHSVADLRATRDLLERDRMAAS